MIKVGEYNLLRVKKEADFGVYLEGVDQEILLPHPICAGWHPCRR